MFLPPGPQCKLGRQKKPSKAAHPGFGLTIQLPARCRMLRQPVGDKGSNSMLYLTRKIGESVVINDEIEVTVVDIRGKSIKLGFTFPPEASVLRREIYDRIQSENQAAAGASETFAAVFTPDQKAKDGAREASPERKTNSGSAAAGAPGEDPGPASADSKTAASPEKTAAAPPAGGTAADSGTAAANHGQASDPDTSRS